ncbi:MAG: AAA family ATPase, partial [Acidimicrobiales bacterium]
MAVEEHPPEDRVLGAKVRAPRPGVLARERVALLLDRAWQHPLTLLIAPAGSGKTTALAQFAARAQAAGIPVAWYRAEGSEGAAADVFRHLGSAVGAAVPAMARRWDSVESAAADLDAHLSHPLALVIDDFHTLEGTAGEAAVGQLVTYLPANFHLLVGTRRPPRFDLSRLRVSGQLAELGPEDLRFRTWEVEQLFRDHYGEPLPPEELADLTRRTTGWAAGLQLFHLATQGKPVVERQQVLRSLSTRLRLVREYLLHNLLDGLDDSLRQFLVRTSVLGLLSPAMCDELLGRPGSAALLAEAERRHLFLTSDDDGETYRCHEVLRSHLAEMLIRDVGEGQARDLQRRAGALLEAAGDSAEALFAYWGAEDWAAADRLLAEHSDIIGGPTIGLGAIPTGLTDRDGWILLATARRQLATGAWPAALDTYRRGESLFGGGRPVEACRRERAALASWVDPPSAAALRAPGADWTAQLRQALTRDPAGVAAGLRAQRQLAATPPGALAAGLADAIAGRLA